MNEHIKDCETENRPLKKTYSGSFNVRITQKMHQKLAETAIRKRITTNQLLKNALSKELDLAINP